MLPLRGENTLLAPGFWGAKSGRLLCGNGQCRSVWRTLAAGINSCPPEGGQNLADYFALQKPSGKTPFIGVLWNYHILRPCMLGGKYLCSHRGLEPKIC